MLSYTASELVQIMMWGTVMRAVLVDAIEEAELLAECSMLGVSDDYLYEVYSGVGIGVLVIEI